MENFTGYLEYTDAQIGRVIDAVAASGELDNTIIIYIVGDNGASAEGGLEGTCKRHREPQRRAAWVAWPACEV
jgi:arylsulfatase